MSALHRVYDQEIGPPSSTPPELWSPKRVANHSKVKARLPDLQKIMSLEWEQAIRATRWHTDPELASKYADVEQRRNERVEETEDPRENPLSRGIVQHDSHSRKSGTDPAGDCTRFALVGGEQPNRSFTAAPSKFRVICIRMFEGHRMRVVTQRYKGGGRATRKPPTQRHCPHTPHMGTLFLKVSRPPGPVIWLRTTEVSGQAITGLKQFITEDFQNCFLTAVCFTGSEAVLNTDLIVQMARRQKREVVRWPIPGALLNIFGPVYWSVEAVSATVFRNVLMQSRSCHGSMFEGVARKTLEAASNAPKRRAFLKGVCPPLRTTPAHSVVRSGEQCTQTSSLLEGCVSPAAHNTGSQCKAASNAPKRRAFLKGVCPPLRTTPAHSVVRSGEQCTQTSSLLEGCVSPDAHNTDSQCKAASNAPKRRAFLKGVCPPMRTTPTHSVVRSGEQCTQTSSLLEGCVSPAAHNTDSQCKAASNAPKRRAFLKGVCPPMRTTPAHSVVRSSEQCTQTSSHLEGCVSPDAHNTDSQCKVASNAPKRRICLSEADDAASEACCMFAELSSATHTARTAIYIVAFKRRAIKKAGTKPYAGHILPSGHSLKPLRERRSQTGNSGGKNTKEGAITTKGKPFITLVFTILRYYYYQSACGAKASEWLALLRDTFDTITNNLEGLREGESLNQERKDGNSEKFSATWTDVSELDDDIRSSC
ncbi:hypothetical protein PR048_014776 [Dryococelus australis]|uniref:Uncharacterized protein n=1 Tax=Dryococelus australis TaxID=614101 RepID=A0ABQ9HFB9_9NEOP|nr:hypothetical protein PR048_014776 [Dryococelus australis]